MYSLRHNMVDISHTNMMNLFQVKNFTACWSSCLLPVINENELHSKLLHNFYFCQKTGCLIFVKNKISQSILFGQNNQIEELLFITPRWKWSKNDLICIHKHYLSYHNRAAKQNFTFVPLILLSIPTNLNFMIGIKLKPSRTRCHNRL